MQDARCNLNIQRCDFHGDWNYTISPRKSDSLMVIRDYW